MFRRVGLDLIEVPMDLMEVWVCMIRFDVLDGVADDCTCTCTYWIALKTTYIIDIC